MTGFQLSDVNFMDSSNASESESLHVRLPYSSNDPEIDSTDDDNYWSFEDEPYSDIDLEGLYYIVMFLGKTYSRVKDSPTYLVEIGNPIGQKFLSEHAGAELYIAPSGAKYYVMNHVLLLQYRDELLDEYRNGDTSVYDKAMAEKQEEMNRLKEHLRLKREAVKRVKKEGESLKGYTDRCAICYDAPPRIVFIDCGHHIVCLGCSKRLESDKCPVCSMPILHTAQTS